MKTTLPFLALVLSALMGCNGDCCCVVGPRNSNGQIVYGTSGGPQGALTKENCKKKAKELGLAADWYEKPCESVSHNSFYWEKGETVN